jgi:NAD(P)-dependent dehydrogenase (short-subunit alcohol dehydrogenase family)
MKRLQDKVAVITGGANGIGLGCATRFAEEGAWVAIIDLDPGDLRAAEATLSALGGKVFTEAGNCTDADTVARFIEGATETLGPIDILVNNVGQGARERKSTFLESKEEVWRFLFELNLFTTMRFSQIIGRQMVAQGKGGRIINMSSESAVIGPVMSHDYAAVKSAIIGFTRSVARELAPHRITVNAILPGPIRTRALQRSSGGEVEKAMAGVLLPFIGEPEDIGGAAAFLASEDGRYVTGHSLMVNGGHWFI